MTFDELVQLIVTPGKIVGSTLTVEVLTASGKSYDDLVNAIQDTGADIAASADIRGTLSLAAEYLQELYASEFLNKTLPSEN